MKSRRISHAHNYGHRNMGDDAMAENVYRKLSHIFGHVTTISTYAPPPDADPQKDTLSLSGIINNYNNPVLKVFLVAVARYQLKPLYVVYSYLRCQYTYLIAKCSFTLGIPFQGFGNTGRLLSRLSETDTYIRSGSGSLNDIWFWSSMFPQYTEAKIANLYGAEVYFLGQGIGPLSTEFRKNTLQNLVLACEAITLRDPEISASLLANLGSKTANWRCAGDDAIDYPIAPSAIGSKFVAEGRKYAICQFRTTDYERDLGQQYWDGLAANLLEIRKENPDIELLAVSFSNGIISDLKAAKLVNAAADKKLLHIIDQQIPTSEMLGLLSGAVVSIGQSYHFGVFSLAVGTPFVGVYSNQYYKEKLTGLLQWYKLGANAVPSNALEKLPAMIKMNITGGQRLRDKIGLKSSELAQQVNKIFNEI